MRQRRVWTLKHHGADGWGVERAPEPLARYRERVRVVPKALADELAECLTIYDEADHLPHGRVTAALVKYREEAGE